MNNGLNIYSISVELNEINAELKPLIQPTNLDEVLAQSDKLDGVCVLFQWQLLPDVLETKRKLAENKVFSIRFICINSDLMPEERLKLLNSNVEFLTIEKFETTSSYFFTLDAIDSKYKILLIEDDEFQIDLTENILNEAHIDVRSIEKGEDALEELEKYQPDLVLMDYNLEGITSDKIVKIIRKNPKHTILPIVILTSDTTEESRTKALNAGADDLLTKPINPELLVSALINRMERSKAIQQQADNSQSKAQDTMHSFEQTDFDELGMFLDLNANNPEASIVWFKIVNMENLQKELGFLAYKNLCKKVLSKILETNKGIDFEVKIKSSDAVFAFAANQLPRNEAVTWAKSVQDWLKSNYFSINGKDYYCHIHPVILSSINTKPEIEYLISAAENLIIDYHTSEEVTFVAEGIEEKKFFMVKTQLEHAIQTRNFKWWYQTIVSTHDPNQEIYQLFIRVMTENGKEISSTDFFDVATKSDLLKLFDRFTFEHSLRIIDSSKDSSIVRKVLINQLASDFENKTERNKKIITITNLNIPDHSLIFQFRQDNLSQYRNVSKEIGKDLKAAKISVCLSNFDCSDMGWQIVDQLKPDWIRILPLKANPKWLDRTSNEYIAHTISKAHHLGIKVMISEVDNSEFAANLWNLNIDYLQGNFIQTPILEEYLSV